MSAHRRSPGRRLPCALPLVIAGCAWGIVIGVAEHETSHTGTPTPTDGTLAILGGAALVLTVAGVSLAVRNACRNSGLIRHPARQKQKPQRHADDRAAGLRTAHTLAAQILTGRPLDPLTVWGLVLRPGETAYFDLTGFHSRLVQGPHGQQRWSDPQPVRIITTSQRMLCDAGTTWRSLWYDDVTGFYPDLKGRNVVLDLDYTAPVKLIGQALCSKQ